MKGFEKWTPEYALEEPRFSNVVEKIVTKYRAEIEKNHKAEYKFKAENSHTKKKHGIIN